MSAPDFFRPRTAMAVIVANMVGTGVFAALGFQLVDITSPFALIMLWVVGGVAALCGALSYAELGAALPRSGGEYNFLGRIYHPAAGFISGWVSTTIGFAAPIAAVAIGFAKYGAASWPGGVPERIQTLVACALVIITALIHSRSRNVSGSFQTGFTALKIVLILGFCAAAFILTPAPQAIDWRPQAGDLSVMTSAAFGVSLIYVSYGYTGWNAATYISGEMENPQRDLPRVLLFGTALVMLLYVLLNASFLIAAPQADMVEQVEVGAIAAKKIFGDVGGRFIGAMLAALLISTVSAMTLAGPRALQAIGQDYPALSWFGTSNAKGVPSRAIWFQSAVALTFILTASFKTIIVLAGSILALNSFLAVFGLFVLRWRSPDLQRPYKTWGYPVTPLIYLLITAFTLVYVVLDNPMTALFAAGVIAVGGVFYLISRNRAALHRDD